MTVCAEPTFRVGMADTPDLLRAAQSLRYDVFVDELGAEGAMVDHAARLEIDGFDDLCDHMLLFDDATDTVAGVYRLIRPEHAQEAGQFYSEGEYDISALKASGRRLLELGRSCLRPSYRGGSAMHILWNGLADYVAQHSIEILFGVASFHGTDTKALAEPLSLLHHRHLAPENLRPKVRGPHGVSMDLRAPDAIDRRAAMVNTPSLIKAYLRLGGMVGQGAWVDHVFNTTDVCLVMDINGLSARQRQIYAGAI